MAAEDLIKLDNVLNKLEPLLVENNGKLVRGYKEQLEDLQRNLKITLNLFKEDANSKRTVEYICDEIEIYEVKKALLKTVSDANQLLDQCSQSAAAAAGNGILGRCMNWFHQHLMGQLCLCTLNQQLHRLNQRFDNTKIPLVQRLQQASCLIKQLIEAA